MICTHFFLLKKIDYLKIQLFCSCLLLHKASLKFLMLYNHTQALRARDSLRSFMPVASSSNFSSAAAASSAPFALESSSLSASSVVNRMTSPTVLTSSHSASLSQLSFAGSFCTSA